MTEADPKAALRRRLRARRRELQAAHPNAGAEAARLYPEREQPAVAGLYWPTGSEIDPRPLGELLALKGTQLALPTVAGPGEALAFRRWRPGDELATDAIGLPTPAPGAGEVTPDLLVTPLLAFDSRGGRLGQGGGYYDRTIAKLRREGRVFVLGLAFAGQEAERLPRETHDEPLDAVLTEAGFRLFDKDT